MPRKGMRGMGDFIVRLSLSGFQKREVQITMRMKKDI
jgi:hypothetical protein